MSFHEDLHNAIRTRFKNQVQDVYDSGSLAGKVAYDNAPFDQPADGSLWVRWSVTENLSQQAEIGDPGNNRFRTFGNAVASIFAPIEMGDQNGLQLADAIKAAFQSTIADGVVYRTPSLTMVGRLNNRYWQINVSCPFHSDQFA